VSSRRWCREHYLGEFYEHSCTGPLVKRDPDGTVTVVRDGLKFANGVVLAPDASHLIFAESSGYRINRYWLTGPKADTVDTFADNLPGLPDSMSLGSDQNVWVGIVARRSELLDKLLPLPGFLRTLAWNVPAKVRPAATSFGWVMAFDLQGRQVYDLRADDDSYPFVTSAAEHDGIVVAASQFENDIIEIRIPAS
jgi:hypothetical protein